MTPKTTFPDVPSVAEGRMHHDVGIDFELQHQALSGGNEDWPVWSARLEADTELAEWSGVLAVVASWTGPLSWTHYRRKRCAQCC